MCVALLPAVGGVGLVVVTKIFGIFDNEGRKRDA